MRPISSPEVIQALLPSRGEFGGSLLDCLEIEVSPEVVSINLEIEADAPTYLNLRRIEFLAKDGAVEC